MRNPRQLIPQRVCRECRLCCRFSSVNSPFVPHLLGEETARTPFCGLEALINPFSCACTFLDETTNLCTLYTQRPFECRLYPFLIHREVRSLYLSVHLACPYIQDNLSAQQTLRYREYLEKWLKTPAVYDTLRKNGGAFASYPKEELILICRI
jgi:Fe-S-cluster containining protein